MEQTPVVETLNQIGTQSQVEQLIEDDRLLMTDAMQEYLKGLERASNLGGWSRFAVFYGEPGVGKSTGARYYAQQRPETIYHIAPPRPKTGYSHPLKLICGIALQMGLRLWTDAFDHFCETLKAQKTFIVIDEAHMVANYLTLHYLKQVAERCPKVRFALVGKGPELRKALEREAASEIRRRARIFREIRKPSAHELCESFPIFRQEVVEFIHRITGGNMSAILNCLEDLTEIQQRARLDSVKKIGLQTVREFAAKNWGYSPPADIETAEVLRRRK